MPRLLVLLITLFGVTTLFAQSTSHRCAFDHAVLAMDHEHPGFAESVQDLFDRARARADRSARVKSGSCAYDTIYRFPVVVHIVYNTPSENLPDSLVFNQIEVLNEDFRRLNSDTGSTRTEFQPVAADVGIEFYLAKRDPQGDPTTGITRTSTSVASFGGGFLPDLDALNDIKRTADGGIDPWPTDKYVNIWVGNTGGSVLGLAYPPAAAPNWPSDLQNTDSTVQGIVSHYEAFGKGNPFATPQISDVADAGRTVVHEMGHYLGLRHIWGDGPLAVLGVPDCSVDDGIDDTPNSGSNSQAAGCDVSKNTCTDTPGPDLPDMFENYMDYSREVCQNIFTRGQADIMRAMSDIGRPGLARIVTNEVFTVEVGDIVIVNGTTFTVDASTVITLETGDAVEFFTENPDVEYTSAIDAFILPGDQAEVACDGEVKSVETTTSIARLDRAVWSVRPNPVDDVLHVALAAHGIATVEVIDLTGRIVETTTTEQVDVSALSPGLYHARLTTTDGRTGVRPVVVE